ncbi:MAG: phosphatidylglycerophosphatase A [Candidatus Omnitrophota bacterium]|jgi:phosphatidylglycerophosphatase A|nr:MAG: phosphatidylglycerophosphatase A [Candidatus Omnitrophota bacterium]
MNYSIPPAKGFPPSFFAASLAQKVAYFVATTFGTGHLPASGTWGALVAWLIHAFLFPECFTFAHWPLAIFILVIIICVGIGSAEMTERLSSVKDDSRVNIDEVAGYCVAVLFLPAGLQYTIPAFILCRVFDIIKPPPARNLQNLHGGVGIMIDDLIASVYACLAMHALIFLGWPDRIMRWFTSS